MTISTALSVGLIAVLLILAAFTADEAALRGVALTLGAVLGVGSLMGACYGDK